MRTARSERLVGEIGSQRSAQRLGEESGGSHFAEADAAVAEKKAAGNGGGVHRYQASGRREPADHGVDTVELVLWKSIKGLTPPLARFNSL